MKYFILNLVCIIILSFCDSFSQTVAKPYEVGTWQGFRQAAVSYTFDDNCPNQLAIAVPMFNEFGFQLTLFTVTNTSWGWPANWSGLQNAASQGHEIASHTVTHPNFTGLADSLQLKELKNSQDVINSHITGYKCVTIAYPYCATGNNSLVRQYYFAARGCSGSVESKTPGNFLNISSIVVGSEGSVKTSADFKTRVDNAANTKGWVVYLIHGINGTEPGAYSPIAADTIRASLNYLKSGPDKFWVTSFGAAAKYVRERNATSVSEISVLDDSITIAVTDTMDNSYYDCPVTIRRPLPEGWLSSIIKQNGKIIDSRIVEVNSVKYIMFDVIPDNGDITIIRDAATGVESQGSIFLPGTIELYQNYPNPFNPATTISYFIQQNEDIQIKVFDVLGNEVATLVNEFKSAGLHSVEFSRSNISSGIYLYRLQTKNFTRVKKLILLQ